MLLRPTLLAALLILPLHAQAQAQLQTAPPHPAPAAPAPNCGLASPPQDAGVDRHMGALLRVYPRNPAIGADYAGCQTLWTEDGEGWAIVTVAHYEAGRVAWIESPLLDHDAMADCRLDGGKVVRGDPGLCADLDEMRFESAPASCLAQADDHGLACARR